jgi:hypothetical protein
MKACISALLGAAGLVALSLSAQAAGSTTVTDNPVIKSSTSVQYMQMARDENPGGGMYKKKKKKKKTSATTTGQFMQLARDENPGGGMYKKKKKKKTTKSS